jgi:hypothetical protein
MLRLDQRQRAQRLGGAIAHEHCCVFPLADKLAARNPDHCDVLPFDQSRPRARHVSMCEAKRTGDHFLLIPLT